MIHTILLYIKFEKTCEIVDFCKLKNHHFEKYVQSIFSTEIAQLFQIGCLKAMPYFSTQKKSVNALTEFR